MQVGEGQQVQIVQAAATQGQAQTGQAQGQTMQVMQQIITNTGEIQQIPVRCHLRLERTKKKKKSWLSRINKAGEGEGDQCHHCVFCFFF